MRSSYQYILSITALAALIATTGCKTATGIKEGLTQSDLRGVQTVLLDVEVDEPFEIYLSRDNNSVAGAMIGGLLGAAIESDIRFKNDRELFEPIAEQLIQFRLQAVIEADLQKQLTTAGVFNQVLVAPSDKKYELGKNQATLEVEVDRWGYRRSPTNNEKIVAFIEYNASLVREDSSSPVWEYDFQIRSSQNRDAESLSKDIDTVRADLRSLVAQLSSRITNELKYAPQN